MHSFRLLLLALVAHAAPGRERIEKRAAIIAAGKEVQFTEFPSGQPMQPWEGYFDGKAPNSGNAVSTGVCSLYANPGENWQFKSASCQRENPNNNTFLSSCAETSQNLQGTQKFGQCAEGSVCSEILGANDQMDLAMDIVCADKRGMRSWYIDTTTSSPPVDEVCSPYYVNNISQAKAVKVGLQVNVFDKDGLSRISPSQVYFRLNDGQQVGNLREQLPTVNSGAITLQNGDLLQACVKAFPGQVIRVSSYLVALARI